jgi:ribosome-associated protein
MVSDAASNGGHDGARRMRENVGMHDSEPFDDDRPPSRSQQRRDALAIFELAEALAAMSDAELVRVPMSDEIRDEVQRTRAVKSHIARKRQTQFLAKQLRKLDDADVEAMRTVLDHDRAEAHQEAAALHRLEDWRMRLIDEGDDALDALLALKPTADRQRLRQLMRNARTERDANRPPHAYRELFRALREAFDENGA